MRFWPRQARQSRVFAVVGMCFAVSTSFAVFGRPATSTMQRPREAAPVAVRVKPEAIAVTPPAKARAPTPFEVEQRMSAAALVTRWDPDVARASRRFRVPQAWIRSVMEAESGGRTMSSETQPIISNKGAMGLMQLMPETWREWRATLDLGTDPYDPHDNITAATAYLHALYAKFGYPAMFAAYNDGPGNLEQRMIDGGLLPQETQLYVARITGVVPMRVGARSLARFTRPDGEAVMINGFAVTAVRAPLPGEYPPNVNTVIAMGRMSQGVCETLGQTTRLLRAHGGRV
jgi:membrane-bound lytic murein transglycosylase B